MRARPWITIAGLGIALAAVLIAPVRAQSPTPVSSPAPASAFDTLRAEADSTQADTSLGGYMRSLSDSTEGYFGRSAEAADTSGLDTLTGIVLTPQSHKLSFAGYPRFAFNRVDGATPGFTLRMDIPKPFGALAARAGWALGSHQRRGSLEYDQTFDRGVMSGVHLNVWGGRATAGMNRERSEGFLQGIKAFLDGGDYTHYLRHDGVDVTIDRETIGWRMGVGYRDELESALSTTTDWNLFHKDLVVPGNLAATTGRAREVEVSGGLRLPIVPVRAELTWQGSGPALHSAFTYDRVRVAAGSDITLGTFASLVPQAMYGFANGAPPPQAAFYLGGGKTLRSLHADERGGSKVAVGRVDLIGAQDVLATLHIPHSAALRISPLAFAAIGSTWGADPYAGSGGIYTLSGPPRSDGNWPERREWLSEAGAALQYDTGGFGTRLAIGYVWPLGPRQGRDPGLLVEVTHPLGLLRAPREP